MVVLYSAVRRMSRLEGLFHVSDTRGKGNYTVGRILRLDSSGRYWEHSRER